MAVFVFDPAGDSKPEIFRGTQFDTSGKTPAFCDDGIVRGRGSERQALAMPSPTVCNGEIPSVCDGRSPNIAR
ncbi:hypothetical protein V1280_001063 [Bradyrhizobium sp. AZCC 2230]